jgi:hypothetical protein
VASTAVASFTRDPEYQTGPASAIEATKAAGSDTVLKIKIAGTSSLEGAVSAGLSPTQTSFVPSENGVVGFQGPIRESGEWFSWVCPGTGSWSLLVDAKCESSTGDAACLSGITIHTTAVDGSEAALDCSGPVDQPNRCARLFTSMLISRISHHQIN